MSICNRGPVRTSWVAENGKSRADPHSLLHHWQLQSWYACPTSNEPLPLQKSGNYNAPRIIMLSNDGELISSGYTCQSDNPTILLGEDWGAVASPG